MDKYQLQRYMEAEPGAKLKDLVTKLLYDEIVSLRILPGTKLNVNQLAASLGISRTPVAEAVAGLADTGFVVTRPGQSGSFVLDLNMVDMIHLYHVRNAIESEAAALCAYAAGDATVRELTMLAEAFKTSVEGRDIRGMRETDMPFHRLIIRACGNPYLVHSYEDILPKLTMYQASMIEFVGQQGNQSLRRELRPLPSSAETGALNSIHAKKLFRYRKTEELFALVLIRGSSRAPRIRP